MMGIDRDVAGRPGDISVAANWQDYLAEQTSSNPLFRRRHLGIAGGKGRVVLTGTVTSFYEKQLAQEFMRRCEGVQQIENEIEVAYADR